MKKYKQTLNLLASGATCHMLSAQPRGLEPSDLAIQAAIHAAGAGIFPFTSFKITGWMSARLSPNSLSLLSRKSSCCCMDLSILSSMFATTSDLRAVTRFISVISSLASRTLPVKSSLMEVSISDNAELAPPASQNRVLNFSASALTCAGFPKILKKLGQCKTFCLCRKILKEHTVYNYIYNLYIF